MATFTAGLAILDDDVDLENPDEVIGYIGRTLEKSFEGVDEIVEFEILGQAGRIFAVELRGSDLAIETFRASINKMAVTTEAKFDNLKPEDFA